MDIFNTLHQANPGIMELSDDELKNALRQSEAIIQALLDLSPFPLTITRIKDGRFMLVNRRQCKITGYSLEQIIGHTPEELNMYLNHTDRKKMIALLQEKGQLHKFETHFKTKDNRIIYAEMSARLIEYQNETCLLSLTTYVNTRSKAHTALRESENRYQNILNSISEGYYECDLSGRFTFFNNATLKIFGYSADELMGMSFKACTVPEDKQKVTKVFHALYLGEMQSALVDHSIIRKDGVLVQIEVSGSLLRDNQGNPIGFYGINRDRTRQKVIEEELRRSEEKHRTVLEEMEEGYYETDLDGNFTYFNDAIVRIHGYSHNELMGMNYRKYLHPDRTDTVYKLYLDIFKTGNSVHIKDYEILRKDGTIAISEISGYPLRDKDGTIVGFWGISRDRTEQRMAEKALKKSEELYRLLVDNANDGIYITQKGRIKYHNPKTSRITGYPDEALSNSYFGNLVHPEDRQTIYEANQEKLDQGVNPEIFSFRILTKDGVVLWVELSAIGIIWEGKSANLNFLRDITQQKKTENQLLQAQKMEAIGTLAGGIAHDFNNILSAIIGYTELALDDKVQGFKQKDILNEVLIASNRAKDLVHQILAFARQSDEKLKPVLVRIIAKEVLKLIRSSIPTTIEIRQKINSNALIMGTPTQIHQIMMNLCTNAAHAMGKTGGTLSVDLLEINIANSHCSMNLPQGNYLELSVTDTGCGIAPNIITTVFDPYFTTKNLGEGTGMGLSVVQGIVEKYGGRITVESQLDKGSTFRVYLPIHEATAEAIQPSKIRLPACHERILIVDDEIAIVKISCLILEQLGYRVTPQTSSIEALRLFRKAPGDFDLVITDMTMPNMTGDQMAEQMLHIRHDLPVILCTGYSKHTNEEMALKIGIRAFIYKPIKKNDLAAIVRKVLDENTVVAERRHGYMKAEGQKNQQSGTFFSGSNVSEIIFK